VEREIDGYFSVLLRMNSSGNCARSRLRKSFTMGFIGWRSQRKKNRGGNGEKLTLEHIQIKNRQGMRSTNSGRESISKL